MDEAEQLCDRLVVMDRGVIAAEGSPLELIREHSTREVAELRFPVGDHDAHGREDRRPRRAGRGAARPASWSTATTASRCSSRCTSAACARSPRWYAAPPWRTSSSGSPAGRWWTDGDRPTATGRPRRPTGCRPGAAWPGSTTTGDRLPAHLEGLGRSRRSSSPLFYVLAMGVLLGGFVHVDPEPARGRDVLPRLRRARPDRRAGDADGGLRDDLPGDGRDQVAQELLRADRQPARGRATSPTPC